MFNVVIITNVMTKIFDKVTQNGFVIDGSGDEGFFADIGIVDELIVAIGNLKPK